MVVAHRKRRDAIDRVGNDLAADRKFGHQNAIGIGGVAELLFEQRHRFRMAQEGDAKRRRGRLPRVVIRRGTDAAEREYDIAARERLAQHRRQPAAVVTLDARP